MRNVFVVLLFMASVTGMAQKRDSHQRSEVNNMTPEQTATLKTKKMTLALDLTDAQQKQIQTLNLENAKTRKAEKDKRKAHRENGESKKPTSDERYALKNERLDRMITHKSEMKEILSPEQYEKWDRMDKRKGKHHKGKHSKDKKQKRHTRE